VGIETTKSRHFSICLSDLILLLSRRSISRRAAPESKPAVLLTICWIAALTFIGRCSPAGSGSPPPFI
jgi:hypothetical protein